MSANDRVQRSLEAARQRLLDLSLRNRLIHTAFGSRKSRNIEVVGVTSAEVFRGLVSERKSLYFAANAADGATDGSPPNDGCLFEVTPSESGAAAHNNERGGELPTDLGCDILYKRLLAMYYDARSIEEEQGVNTLHLAMGFLRWFESESSGEERFAPLLLIPVSLDRPSPGARSRVQFSDEDITTNLSLQKKLESDFGLRLPDVPDGDSLDPDRYFDLVENKMGLPPHWKIERNRILLWFFSFSKLRMHEDLLASNWPVPGDLLGHRLIDALLDSSFREVPSLCGDDEPLDPIIAADDMVHVLDADGSQAIAIEEVRRGLRSEQHRDLMIQGPPGTGKSQTIANVIGSAVKDGKTILFVAEKKAALEVVKAYLDKIDLGRTCLELHARKATKAAVLAELKRAYESGKASVPDVKAVAASLDDARGSLNSYATALGTPLEPCGISPFAILGELTRLKAEKIPTPSFAIQDPLTWTRADIEQRLRLLERIEAQLTNLGDPRCHAWRGVMAEAILPMDLARLEAELPSLIKCFQELVADANELDTLLNTGGIQRMSDIAEICQIAKWLLRLTVSDLDRAALADPVWVCDRPKIAALVALGVEFANLRAAMLAIVDDGAWCLDACGVRRTLETHARSLLRWFNRSYRGAIRAFRGTLREPLPKTLDKRFAILDRIIRLQELKWELDVRTTIDERGRRAFGTLWRGSGSDWHALKAIDTWESEARAAGVARDFRRSASRINDTTRIVDVLTAIEDKFHAIHEHAHALLQFLGFDFGEAFGVPDMSAAPLREMIDRFDRWIKCSESVTEWTGFRVHLSKLREMGLGDLATRILEGQVAAESMVDRFKFAFNEALVREAWRVSPGLAQFNGASHKLSVADFCRLDRQRIELARLEVSAQHHAGIRVAEHGYPDEFRLLFREMNKKRNHLALRELCARAPHAVQSLKPVFMMSPISAAQFLKPGGVSFDLLIIDEASQVRPEDALGAVARARQLVVVGDDKQLPPTSFFNQVLADDDEDDLEDAAVVNVESILGLCAAQKIAQRMLRWHYRSRHDSLIRVSNQEFYEAKLHVVPSALEEPNTGLRFHHVSNGIYDRGGSATNRIEAEAVAAAVIEHARTFPGQSLGVGTFSVAQRDAIRDALDLLQRRYRDVESFFAPGNSEPFFVKNLETIQGDERDVIFVSVGYGRDSSGRPPTSFGALSNSGGERRLNVLMTRARDCCRVFSSITADDIDLGKARSRGAEVLKVFLAYARDRKLDVPKPGNGEHDSEFERQVARAVRSLGFEVHAQVGSQGFFIDLAVVDPERPGCYLIGIECDGRQYHSARWARDRDRLRQQILEGHGWTIHRIWSTDWFNRPDEQLRKVAAAIENAKATIAADPAPPASGAHGFAPNSAPANSPTQAGPNAIEHNRRHTLDESRHSTESSNNNGAKQGQSPTEDVQSAVLRAFTKRQQHSKTKERLGLTILLLDLKKEVPISEAALVPVLAEMVRAGVLIQTGEGRGARYQRP